jgi:SPP1 family predicted phage head-tail adaptor
MNKTDPAKFNKWISIVDDSETIGDGGTIEKTETTDWEGWAAIWPASAKEARENMREGLTVTHTVRMYYRDGIDATMRVLFGNRSFDIVSIINPEEADVYLDLVCAEIL